MNKPSPVTEKGKAMRLKLKEAAKVVFGEKGYIETRVSDITQLANISEGNFYRYFMNKDDILEELIEEMINELYEDSKVQAYTGDLKERLELSTMGILKSYKKHAQLYKVLVQLSNYNPVYIEKWKAFRKPFVTRVKKVLEKQEIKEDYDLDYLASALGSMVHQFAYIWCVLEGEEVEKELDLVKASKMLADIWYQTIIAFK